MSVCHSQGNKIRLVAIPQMPLNLNSTCHSLRGLHYKIGSASIPFYLVDTKGMCGVWPNTIHNGTASHCSQNLGDYVEKKALRTHVTAGQEPQGDGRVQMGTANVTYTLS